MILNDLNEIWNIMFVNTTYELFGKNNISYLSRKEL